MVGAQAYRRALLVHHIAPGLAPLHHLDQEEHGVALGADDQVGLPGAFLGEDHHQVAAGFDVHQAAVAHELISDGGEELHQGGVARGDLQHRWGDLQILGVEVADGKRGLLGQAAGQQEQGEGEDSHTKRFYMIRGERQEQALQARLSR